MIIDINKGSEGFGRYVTGRDKNSYVIIDGDLALFETTAEYYRTTHNVENPYYRVLLSFDEEHLDTTDITEIYLAFKEKFLSNYDPEEYQCFSVIHFDDEKPHVHMGIISNNLINHKELRLMRGLTDVKRIDSTAETLNYEFNLKSDKNSVPILKLAKDQKERNWKVKKGANWYPCITDSVYDFIDSASKSVANFEDFISVLKKEYPFIKFTPTPDIFGQYTAYIGETKIKSFIFNKEWFISNLEEIRDKPLSSIKTSIKREDYEFYKKDLESRNLHHKLHLIERNIHEGLLEHKLKSNQINIEDFDVDYKKLYNLIDIGLETNVNKLLFKDTILEISKITKSIEELEILLNTVGATYVRSGFDDKKGGKYITIEKNGTKMIIPSEELYYIANTKLEDIYSGRKEDISLKYSNKRVQTFEEKMNVLTPTKNYERMLIKNEILNEVANRNIKTKEEFEIFLNSFGASFIKTGNDIAKGDNITIQFKNKNIMIFSSLLNSFYNPVFESSNTKITNDLLTKTVDTIFYKDAAVESLNEFKLNNSPTLNYSIESNDTNDLYYNKDEDLDTRDRNQKNIIEDNNVSIVLKKSLDMELAAQNLVQKLIVKQWENISINGTREFKDYVLKEILLHQKNLPSLVNIYDSELGHLILKNGQIIKKELQTEYIENDIVKPENQSKEINPNDLIMKFKTLIDNLDLNKNNKENNIILTHILNSVAKLNDDDLFKATLSSVSLVVREAKETKKLGKHVVVNNVSNIEDKTIIKDDVVYDFVTKPDVKNIDSLDEKLMQIKKRSLEILYNKSFENSPILNYEIKTILNEKNERDLEYSTENTIFIDKGNEILIYKSKDLIESAKDVLEVLKNKDLSKELNIVSSNEFKQALLIEAEKQGINLKLNLATEKEVLIRKGLKI